VDFIGFLELVMTSMLKIIENSQSKKSQIRTRKKGEEKMTDKKKKKKSQAADADESFDFDEGFNLNEVYDQ